MGKRREKGEEQMMILQGRKNPKNSILGKVNNNKNKKHAKGYVLFEKLPYCQKQEAGSNRGYDGKEEGKGEGEKQMMILQGRKNPRRSSEVVHQPRNNGPGMAQRSPGLIAKTKRHFLVRPKLYASIKLSVFGRKENKQPPFPWL